MVFQIFLSKAYTTHGQKDEKSALLLKYFSRVVGGNLNVIIDLQPIWTKHYFMAFYRRKTLLNLNPSQTWIIVDKLTSNLQVWFHARLKLDSNNYGKLPEFETFWLKYTMHMNTFISRYSELYVRSFMEHITLLITCGASNLA